MHGHTAAERVGRAFAAGRRARRCSRTMLRSAKICSIRSSFMCTRSSTCEHGVRPDRLRATMLLISARRKPKRRAWITNASSDNRSALRLRPLAPPPLRSADRPVAWEESLATPAGGPKRCRRSHSREGRPPFVACCWHRHPLFASVASCRRPSRLHPSLRPPQRSPTGDLTRVRRENVA